MKLFLAKGAVMCKCSRMLIIPCLLIYFFSFTGTQVSADEVILHNGDRLTGNIKQMDKGILILETDYSDPIEIQQAKIKSISTDFPAEVRLSSGEVLKGKLRSHEDNRLSVEANEERVEVSVAWERISALNPPPAQPSRWQGNVAVGASLQTGNTDRISATIGVDFMRKALRDRYNLRFIYNYAEDDDEVIARNIFGALKYDYFFTTAFYGFLAMELLSDEFKDLNLRTIVGPGVGYQLWDDEIKSLLFEAGLSFFSEDLDEGSDDQWITGRMASQIRWKIFDKIVFTDYLLVYPSLEDIGAFKLRNEAGISSAIGTGWSLKLSNILEHDSDPPVNVEKNDMYWVLGLQYSF